MDMHMLIQNHYVCPEGFGEHMSGKSGRFAVTVKCQLGVESRQHGLGHEG